MHSKGSDALKDVAGNPITLGPEYTVLTDTSDEDEPSEDGNKQRLLSAVPSNAIPTTIPTPVQMLHKVDGKRRQVKNGKRLKALRDV